MSKKNIDLFTYYFINSIVMSTQKDYDTDCNIIDVNNNKTLQDLDIDNKLNEVINEKNNITEMIKQLKEKEEFLEKEKIRIQNEKVENDRLEKERLEAERIEKERLEKERIEREKLDFEEKHQFKIKEEYSDEYIKMKHNEIINNIESITKIYVEKIGPINVDSLRNYLINNKIIGINIGPICSAGNCWYHYNQYYLLYINIYGEVNCSITSGDCRHGNEFNIFKNLKNNNTMEVVPRNFIDNIVTNNKLIGYFYSTDVLNYKISESLTISNERINNISNLNIWQIEKNKLFLKTEKERILKEGKLTEENINLFAENIMEELPNYNSYCIPGDKNSLLDKFKKLKIVGIINYITGLHEDFYTVRGHYPHPFIGETDIRTKYTYNNLNTIFIDIYGNFYKGTCSDIITKYNYHNPPTQQEFNQFIYIKPFEKELDKKDYNLTTNELNNLISSEKLEIFNNIKRNISTDIFNTTKKIKELNQELRIRLAEEDFNKKNRELRELTNKYKLPFEKFYEIHSTDNSIASEISDFLKSYVGEIKYELFENNPFISQINIVNYINKCIQKKLDKENLEKQKIENERLTILKKEQELKENKKKQEELLRQQKLNNTIQSFI